MKATSPPQAQTPPATLRSAAGQLDVARDRIASSTKLEACRFSAGLIPPSLPFFQKTKIEPLSTTSTCITLGGYIDGTEPLVLALARAFRWQRYIDEGRFKNIRELAAAVGQDKSVIASIMRLRLLSPAIVHRIVTGNIPRSLTLANLKNAIPDIWTEQEERWIGGDAMSWGEG